MALLLSSVQLCPAVQLEPISICDDVADFAQFAIYPFPLFLCLINIDAYSFDWARVRSQSLVLSLTLSSLCFEASSPSESLAQSHSMSVVAVVQILVQFVSAATAELAESFETESSCCCSCY